MRAGGAAAAAVAAANGSVAVAELVEVAVSVDGVTAHQNGRREVGRDQHVRPVRSDWKSASAHALQCALFRVFDRRRKFLSSPVRNLKDGGGHATLVSAVLDAAGQRVADTFLAVKLQKRVEDFYPLKLFKS